MFQFVHNCINVLDLSRSLSFYQDALGLIEQHRIERPGFTLVFLGDGVTTHQLELTHLHDRTSPYDLGDNEMHIAFSTPDIAAAHKKHDAMGCICYENTAMGIYFIADPDGYWLEILPQR